MINALLGKRIVLGISGGIAAYKGAELTRRLRESGAQVRVVMTRAACEFIGPLTLQALSGRPVCTDLLDVNAEAAMGHIEIARWADAVIIAPASADIVAKLAHGLADDLLSTVCLATAAPLLVAPAMNQQMWLAAATQANMDMLKKRSAGILGPADGEQACGEIGPGRMLEVRPLIEALNALFMNDALAGLKVLVTAGPTREAIDPVRYLSNRSSGKMGYAVARASAEAGAAVTLISGPSALAAPETVRCVAVTTAKEMARAVTEELTGTNIFIAAAAVADYRSATTGERKLKRGNKPLTLTLVPNPDILASVAGLPAPPFTVGFAAETEQLAVNARAKLERKGVDMIAANDVSRPDLGFESDDNSLSVYWRQGERRLPSAPKEKLARQLVALIAERYHARYPA
ncbi:MAG TPA: bifunctional phosphopantothenoylcysteine decarboxylase/phosphopantothenate--cysteine ligase CoaBC [Gammaproteobacteria bacterium]|nr:bifunctional phosphopantothenoylcysteine decarboxylase/phosphopantothenate--cysteine ligase CoaBC [Gammaproteobacteria bacterium]